jgi:sugar lactone lactonase YvrE
MVFDSAGNLYITSYSTGDVGKYTAAGGVLNSTLFTVSGGAYGLAIDASDNLYVVAPNSARVGKYTSSGGVINAAFLTGLSAPFFTAVDGGGNVYVNTATGIARYSPAGALLNSTFITGLSNPGSFAFLAVPEPSTWALLLTGLGLLVLPAVRRRS